MFGTWLPRERSCWALLHHWTPKEAGGCGGGGWEGTIPSPRLLPPAVADNLPFFPLPLPLDVFLKEYWNFVFLFLSSFVFTIPHAPSLHLLLIAWPLENKVNSLTPWREIKKQFLSWGWRSWRSAEDNRTSLPEKDVSCFLVCPGKVLLLQQAKDELLRLPGYSFTLPCQNQDTHSPFSKYVLNLPSNELLIFQVIN